MNYKVVIYRKNPENEWLLRVFRFKSENILWFYMFFTREYQKYNFKFLLKIVKEII